MNHKKFAAGLGMFLLMAGCMKDMQKEQTRPGDDTVEGKYTLTEKYEVTGGPREGMKGESVYTIRLRRQAESPLLLLENFANAYDVQAERRGDSLFIGNQKFPYYDDSVTISGSGAVRGGALSLEYFSGGPAGQIKGVCGGERIQ